ncbi:MAG TPA: dihydrodipicolinate reductase [Vicinamibacteria bacterium]
MPREIKVVFLGLGPIGRGIAKIALETEGIKVVGATDPSPEHAGKDLGTVLGLPRKLRIKVQGDPVKFVRKVRADVAVLSTTSSAKALKAQALSLFQKRLHVVTTCEELSYPVPANEGVFRELDRAAKRKKVSILGTGVNPGFAMDALPLMLTAPCRKVNRVVVTRVVDAGTRRLPLQRKVGAGLNIAQFRRALTEGTVRHVGLPESVHMIAAGLGWKLSKVDETIEPAIAPRDLDTEFLRVPAGNAAGIKQSARGYFKNGELAVSLDLHMYVGAENPRDHVMIDGEPPIDMTITGGVAGDIATAAIAVNAIPRLLAARAGVVTMKDLAPVVRFSANDLKTLPKKKA